MNPIALSPRISVKTRLTKRLSLAITSPNSDFTSKKRALPVISLDERTFYLDKYYWLLSINLISTLLSRKQCPVIIGAVETEEFLWIRKFNFWLNLIN